MDLEYLISKIKKNNFLLIGRAGIDIYPDPPGTQTKKADKFVAHLGGSAANIAVALVNFGAEASIVTSVSDDALGKLALNELKKYNIKFNHVNLVGGESRLSLAIVETRIKNHQSIIYRNDAADLKMNLNNIKKINFKNYGCLIVTGTALAKEPSRSATFKALTLAKKFNIPRVIDLDYRPYTWKSIIETSRIYNKAIKLCDITIGNDLEFDIIAKKKGKGLFFAKKLNENTNSIVVYKMGENGSITFTREKIFKTGIFPVAPIKPTGAGDAFMGGFLSGIALGKNIEDSVYRGSATAAIVVTKVGCSSAMPSLNDLNKFLYSNLKIKINKVLKNAYTSIRK